MESIILISAACIVFTLGVIGGLALNLLEKILNVLEDIKRRMIDESRTIYKGLHKDM